MCLSSLKNWWDWKTILSCWKCPHFWGDILIFRGLFGWTFIFCISLKWSLFGEDPIILRQIHCGCVSKLKGSESPNLIGFPIKGVHFQNFKVFKVFSDIFTKNRWFVVGCINFPLSLVNFQPQKKQKVSKFSASTAPKFLTSEKSAPTMRKFLGGNASSLDQELAQIAEYYREAGVLGKSW